MVFIFVLIGGGIGAVSRYIVSKLLRKLWPNIKELTTTLIINGIGSLGLGLVIGSNLDFAFLTGITVGLIGSFTTFSTFALDCMKLIQEKNWPTCISYIFCTVFLSMCLYAIGYYII